MRKLLLFSLVFLSFSSCQKNSESFIGNDDSFFNKSSLNIEPVMSLKTTTARQNAFSSLLTPEEKCEFMISRLRTIIEDFKFDKKQLSVINDLQRFIKPEVYKRGSKLNIEFLAYEPSWRESARLVFSADQIRHMFTFKTTNEFKEEMEKNKIETAAAAGSENTKDCDCSVKSEYCSNDCIKSFCQFDDYACGTLFLYDCDGLCK